MLKDRQPKSSSKGIKEAEPSFRKRCLLSKQKILTYLVRIQKLKRFLSKEHYNRGTTLQTSRFKKRMLNAMKQWPSYALRGKLAWYFFISPILIISVLCDISSIFMKKLSGGLVWGLWKNLTALGRLSSPSTYYLICYTVYSTIQETSTSSLITHKHPEVSAIANR